MNSEVKKTSLWSEFTNTATEKLQFTGVISENGMGEGNSAV